MKNNKGYSLVELLAVIVILGIIAVLSIVGYTNYIKYSREKAYDTMARSAANAAGEYSMDYLGVNMVTLAELTEEEYLEYPHDPSNKGSACTGRVDIKRNQNAKGLDTEEYDVTLCCANYNYTYHFPGGNKVKNHGGCATDVDDARLIEPDSTKDVNCAAGKTSTISKSIYTMNYLGRTCEKNESTGTYTSCGSLACRRYEYVGVMKLKE